MTKDVPLPSAPPTPAESARRAARLPDEALSAECDESFFVASGPGGQHRNKTETAVRLTHRPTGTTVQATERRSQWQNRRAALERMRAALAALGRVDRPRHPTRPTAGARRRRREAKQRLAQKKAERRRTD